MFYIPPALVLGCNNPVSLNPLKDWIEEQTGFEPDFQQSGYSESGPDNNFRAYGCQNGEGFGDGYYSKYGYLDGDGSGCGEFLGNLSGGGRGFSADYGSLYGNGYGNGDDDIKE